MTVKPTANQGGDASAIGAQQISVDIEGRHDQPDIRLAFVVAFADMLAIENGEPNAEHDQPGSEWEEMGRVEEVEYAAGGGEDREGADAARAPDRCCGRRSPRKRSRERGSSPISSATPLSEGAEMHRKIASIAIRSWQLDWTYHTSLIAAKRQRAAAASAAVQAGKARADMGAGP